MSAFSAKYNISLRPLIDNRRGFTQDVYNFALGKYNAEYVPVLKKYFLLNSSQFIERQTVMMQNICDRFSELSSTLKQFSCRVRLHENCFNVPHPTAFKALQYKIKDIFFDGGHYFNYPLFDSLRVAEIKHGADIIKESARTKEVELIELHMQYKPSPHSKMFFLEQHIDELDALISQLNSEEIDSKDKFKLICDFKKQE